MQRSLFGRMLTACVLSAVACASPVEPSEEAQSDAESDTGNATEQRQALGSSCFVAIDLGTLGGPQSFATKISDNGLVVGNSETSRGETHPFLWWLGVMRDLGFEAGAVDVNLRAQVTGTFTASDGAPHAYRWQHGVTTDLGTLGGSFSTASDMNERGQVTGDAALPSGFRHAFLWDRGVLHDLGTLEDGLFSTGRAINERGQVTGSANTGPEQHAFLWSRGVMHDLGTLGGNESVATALNNRGEVAGYSATSQGERHAFLWSHGVMTDLGTLGSRTSSAAASVNDRGQVAGVSGVSPFEQAVFLWERGVMTAVSPPVEAAQVNDLNEWGQIVGYIVDESGLHAFSSAHGVFSLLPPSVGTQSAAADVNNFGFVVGESWGEGAVHATLWAPKPCSKRG